jgi:acetyl-CoA C-acetyltransferase
MTAERSVIFATRVRTAIGTAIGAFGGSLKDVPASDLGAVAIKAAIERAGIEPAEIGAVVMGSVVQAGNKMNPARQAAVHGGIPVAVPALTVNRVCGSGAQAIVSAAQEILLGNLGVAVAGGMENMDLALPTYVAIIRAMAVAASVLSRIISAPGPSRRTIATP